ncbi:hypothetical protein CVIRNUC_007391 [Coccomyxa viridis]|uniref:Histidine-containing phosphotransfer protein n=1 Tax=Coccomyxa viridis TaxID=1274662 RepID=A0AAV1IAS4_9CHLO|nr:hypothetical protein CVIRNUC_007391 [Coccomyxa viridis]
MQPEVAHINQQIDQLLNGLGQEGLLDDQFAQLMQLQDESNPDFVAEVVELYFEDSAGKLDKLEGKLAAPTPDFNDIDQLVHQFKGSSASFGAQKLAALCVQLRDGCMRSDRHFCQALLQEVKKNFAVLKSRLEIFMQLETQRKQLSNSHH